MKLHLNLTLRRALMAAMAMVAVHTAQADVSVTYNTGDAYITGEGTLTQSGWNGIWNKHKSGSLTIGTSEGAAVVTLDGKSTYNKAQYVFIGGVGNNSGGTVANDGTLNVGAATMNVEQELNVGSSQVGGTGLLTINGGTVNAANGLYVGVYEGNGIIEGTNATINVTSGKDGAAFAMGYRESIQGGEIVDTVVLSGNSKITVGAAGGAVDVTTIGRGGGMAILGLEDNTVATFHDQTIVGELSSSNGSIYVYDNSTLNLGSQTVLGVSAGAQGHIYVEGKLKTTGVITVGQGGSGSLTLAEDAQLTAKDIVLGSLSSGDGVLGMYGDATATVERLFIGADGKGNMYLADNARLTASKLIDVGASAGSLDQSSTLVTAEGTELKTPELYIGATTTGSAEINGKLQADSIYLGTGATGKGTLAIGESAQVSPIKNLYAGYNGTGVVTTEADLAAQNVYIAGAQSSYTAADGTSTLTNVTVLEGKLITAEAATTIVGGELILQGAAQLINSGDTSVTNGLVLEGASIKVVDGTLTTTTLTNAGSITNKGTWNAASTTSSKGAITNEGTMNAGSLVSTDDTIKNSGTLNVNGSLTSNGSSITNSGDMVVAGSMNSSTSTITNTKDGEMTLKGSVMASAGTISNAGVLSVEGSLVTTAVSLVNDKTMYASGSITNTAGSITNNGTLDQDGVLTNVAGSITNNGTYLVDGTLSNTAGAITNAGSLTVNGTMTSSAATIANTGSIIVAKSLSTSAGIITNSGTITVEKGGSMISSNDTISLTDKGALNVAGSLITNRDTISVGKDASITVGGTMTSTGGSITNDGDFIVDGTMDATATTLTSNGTIAVGGSLVSSSLSGTGSVTIDEGADWTISGVTSQGSIANNGEITIKDTSSVVVTDKLSGTGSTTIVVGGRTGSTYDNAILSAGSMDSTFGVTVEILTSEAAALVGKDVNFLQVGGNLVEIDTFTVGEGWTIDWDNNRIYTGDTNSGQQLSFVGDETGMYFTKLGAVETIEVVTESAANVTVELEVVTETAQTVTETGKEIVTEGTDEALQDFITKDDSVKSVEIGRGLDENQEEVRTNVIIGKNVTSSGDADSTKVQSIVVNQKTTVEIAGTEDQEGETKEIKETVGVSGVALVLDGTSKHEGSGKDSGAELGFKADSSVGSLATKDDEGNTVINEVSKIDVVHVSEGADVTVANMSMHSTHALTVSDGATLTFDGVSLHVGGTTDINLTKEVEVKVYDEQGEIVKVENEAGELVDKTETKVVESDTHLTTDTVIANATLVITGGSEVKFEKIDSGNADTTFGSTTITNSVVEVAGTGTVLGDSQEHMQQIQFDEASQVIVKDEAKVDNAVFSNGAALTSVGGTVTNVTFDSGTTLKGTGSVSNVTVAQGGKLTVGNSPGKMEANNLTVDGEVEFFIITNSEEWQRYDGTSGSLSTDYQTGSFSQLIVGENVTLNGKVTIVYQEKLADGTYANCDDQQAARDEVAYVFTEGDGIRFVDGNLENLTLGSGYWFDTTTLPELEDGMFWDFSDFLTGGVITVVGEILEEPGRIANTLVSAGETVLDFGRVAESQAALRQAGTTRTWASALAMFDSVDGSTTTNGYDYNAWGAAVGVDHAFSRNTVIGAAFGCTWGENESERGNEYYGAGSVDQDSKMVALYGTHKFQTKGLLNDMKLSAFAAYGWFTNDSTRKALNSESTATAEWDSEAWVLSASVSRDITTDGGVVVTPYVGVEYTKATMDSFTEKGRVATADYTADEDYSNLSVKVGVNVSKTFGSFTPYAGISYINDVDRTAGKVTATGRRGAISAKSALPGRDALQLRAGATWQLTESMDLNAGYTAELRDKATEQRANVGIGITF